MKKINRNHFILIMLLISVVFSNAQSHSVQWIKNENFEISQDLNTINHNIQLNFASLLSSHYLDFGENGYVELYNLEDLKDFSVFLESEDKLGNTSKDYGLLFNHILTSTSDNSNQELDSLIVLEYSKYQLKKVTSKDGTEQLKTRDFKILDHGKIVEALDNPKSPIAIPYDFVKTIRIEKSGTTIYIKKNGEILKTFINVPQAKYRIGIHSYINDNTQLNQVSINTSFLQTGALNGTKDIPLSTETYCVNVNVNNTINWTSKCSYDINGKVIGSKIDYFNEFGRSTQSQNVDPKTKRIWASQVIYDSQGRTAFNSSSSPKGNTFGYKQNFIVNEDGNIYTKEDFEGVNSNNPLKVSNQTNTLGNYYSEINTSETYQDITNYPFSVNVFSELNPGKVLKTLGGNKINIGDGEGEKWAQGFTYTVPVAQEMHYVFGKDYFFNSEFNSNPNDNSVNTKFFKTVSVNINGIESVVFNDSEGNILASARSGANYSYEVVSVIGEQGYIDIHIPQGIINNQIFPIVGSSESDYVVYNLRTEEEILFNEMVGGNFYRITRIPDDYAKVNILPNNSIVTDSASGVRYSVNYYDFTLNYYDKSGKLKETVQPLGFDNSNLLNGTFDLPNHTMKNTFKYDSLGLLTETSSPDEGTAKFKYRRDGQIRFSQNSKQFHANTSISEISYTNYDNFGRSVESGVVQGHVFDTLNPNTENNFTGVRNEVNITLYDVADENFNQTLLNIDSNFPIEHYQQAFIASNVSKTWNVRPFTNITWYSYDIYGRVTWLVQYIEGLGIKTIDYVYDPVTSNVNNVIYQKYQEEDYFEHVYTYDNDTNQLIKVVTKKVGGLKTVDNRVYTTHAEYTYYESGALKRIQYPNQGVDYVYNLSGQLKSINHPSLEQSKDPGDDDNDIFGLTLDYYNGDYLRTNTPTPIETTSFGTNQYNGNIKALRWKTRDLSVPNGNSDEHNAQIFTYNQNNWLQEARFGRANNNTASFTPTNSYRVFDIDYDKNGNIQHLNRNMLGDNPMDRLSYTYQSNSNKLKHVSDNVSTGNEVNDIKDQEVSSNYGYNSIGQLTINHQDDVTYEYNASGLVTVINEITSNNHSLTLVESIDYEDKNTNKTSLQSIWTTTGNAMIDLHNFSVQSDKKGLLDYCKDLAENNINALVFSSINKNFTASRTFNASPNVINEISFDAIIKQLLDTNNVFDNLTIIASIIENGTILQQTQFSSENTCSFYAKERLTLNFTPTTNQITVQLSVQNTNENSLKTTIFIDNIERNLFATRPAVKFYYDDKGKRIRKERYIYDGLNISREITYYVRDVSGSPMAIYNNIIIDGQTPPSAVLKEQPIYGLSRLGVYYKQEDASIGWNGYIYELTDHLGNVRATFANVSSALDRRGATDYYPFGMLMPDRRNVDANGYRYAYQGQEKDSETGKEAFELRLWDGRIGRWLTTDPKNGGWSPYWGMNNNPIKLIDPDGGKIVYGESVNIFQKFKIWFSTLRRRVFSKKFRKMYKTLKKSDLTYTLTINEHGRKGYAALFTAEHKFDLPSDDWDGLTPLPKKDPSKAGGTIFINPSTLKNSKLLGEAMTEEIIHANQFQFYVGVEYAKEFEYGDYGASNGVALGNIEFEAKMIAGVVNREAGLPFYKDKYSATEFAQRSGVNVKNHKTPGLNGYFQKLNEWRAKEDEMGGAYRGIDINLNFENFFFNYVTF